MSGRRHPCRVTISLRDPAWFRCSHNQMPCHVPSARRPSLIGNVNDDPRKHAFTWAGCNRSIRSSAGIEPGFRAFVFFSRDSSSVESRQRSAIPAVISERVSGTRMRRRFFDSTVEVFKARPKSNGWDGVGNRTKRKRNTLSKRSSY